MSVTWTVRFWLTIIVICTVLLLTGCASIQTSDCKRNSKGVWTCTEKKWSVDVFGGDL